MDVRWDANLQADKALEAIASLSVLSAPGQDPSTPGRARQPLGLVAIRNTCHKTATVP